MDIPLSERTEPVKTVPQARRRKRRYRDLCLSREERIERLPQSKKDLLWRLLLQRNDEHIYG